MTEYGKSCFQWAVSSLCEEAKMRNSSQMWLKSVLRRGNSQCKGKEAGTGWAERWPAVWGELSDRGGERSTRSQGGSPPWGPPQAVIRAWTLVRVTWALEGLG